MWTAVLFIHIASGSLALLAGPVAMLLPKRRGWHTRLGTGYVVLVVVLSASAIGLAAMKPALWWLGVVAGVLYCWQRCITKPARHSVRDFHFFSNSLTNLVSAVCCWVDASWLLTVSFTCASACWLEGWIALTSYT